MSQQVENEHNRAAWYALAGRYWDIYSRYMVPSGDPLFSRFAQNMTQWMLNVAEQHSDRAAKLETKEGAIFPGVKP